MTGKVKNIISFDCEGEKLKEILDHISILQKTPCNGITLNENKEISGTSPDINIVYADKNDNKKDKLFAQKKHINNFDNNLMGFNRTDVTYCESRIVFYTDCVIPEFAINPLVKSFPEIPIMHQWASKKVGFDVGEVEYYKKNKTLYKVLENGTKEAFELSAEIHDVNLIDLGYKYNKKIKTFEFIDKEEINSAKKLNRLKFSESY